MVAADTVCLLLIRAAVGREEEPAGAASSVCSVACIRANTHMHCIQTCECVYKAITRIIISYTQLPWSWSQLARYVFGPQLAGKKHLLALLVRFALPRCCCVYTYKYTRTHTHCIQTCKCVYNHSHQRTIIRSFRGGSLHGLFLIRSWPENGIQRQTLEF